MEQMTIRELTARYGVSTRTLRYYEEIGLLESLRADGYAYRVYAPEAVQRLARILLLRKLRVPLKQIGVLLDGGDLDEMVAVLRENVNSLDQQIQALDTIRSVLQAFLARLGQAEKGRRVMELLADSELVALVEDLSPPLPQTKGDLTMSQAEQVQQADQRLSRLTNVRIVHLPPSWMACAHYVGESPENHAGEMLTAFIRESGLYGRKPDARVYGFNHPNPTKDQPVYGYEFRVTIPEDLEVAGPLTKQFFPGGLYAGHTIAMGNFNEWGALHEWVAQGNDKYVANTARDGGQRMYGLLEEAINWVYNVHTGKGMDTESQIELLYPIRPKTPADAGDPPAACGDPS
ncbi:MAG TPA: effector binding domain-containing protein [Clostridia bacterium]|nr:effector binding domain-containing protein [Clostridia bacterium]